MSRRKEVKKSAAVAAVVAIVLVASAVVLFRTAPERVAAASPDGVARISGVAFSPASVTIQRINDVVTDVDQPLTSAYQLSIENSSLRNGELVVALPHNGVDLANAVIYIFDRDALAWTPLPTMFSVSNASVSAPIDIVGSTLIIVGARGEEKN